MPLDPGGVSPALSRRSKTETQVGKVLSRKALIGVIVLASGAGVVTWLAMKGPREANERKAAVEEAVRLAEGEPANADLRRVEPTARIAAAPSAGERPAASAPPAPANSTRAPQSLSLDAPPLVDAAGPVDSNVTLTGTKLPPIKANDASAAKSLLDSMHLYCKFADGSSGNADNDTFKPGGSFFAAGPVTFIVLDLPTGRAQMNGDAGGASSPSGTSPMRVTATENSLNFSGITPLGEVTLTTIFATKTPTGRFSAVTSRHGLREPYHISAQWFGSCAGDAQ
jgi:hypothetical protein